MKIRGFLKAQFAALITVLKNDSTRRTLREVFPYVALAVKVAQDTGWL